MADEIEKREWYVLRCVGGQEKKISNSIITEVCANELSDDLGEDDVKIPTEKIVQIRKGKKVTMDRVLFPGYIMINPLVYLGERGTYKMNGELPNVIKAVTGVVGFLSERKGGNPVPMRQKEVNRMLGQLDDMALQSDNVDIPYEIGQTVKVIDGPFKGYDGVVEELNEEKRKLRVAVKVFARRTPLELSYMQVDKIS